MRFRTIIVSGGGNTTGIEVPPEVVESFGAGKRVPVTATINGYSYRSTVAPYRGPYMLSLSAENRAGAGVAAGDEVEVDLELDTAPREVEVPPDLAAALADAPAAVDFFGSLSPSQKKAFTVWITEAKKPETRASRVATAVEMLTEGKRR
ncbi:YdeI/OmpD-associated family protein [Herbiconiux sp. L3-i23]|uniref:YdeI/OmpD-associated family protein n=1 Tax=Herbiconiux sp. L3-i23 TaxID=2905871 RepID=UPI0020472C0E|nr:YdeI/OmpD-associated family protein [Herbiconiux sp. L3-i23]BDI22676.1 hypothetical protein L3i23_14520 [Herbiconiux sp. L3-i23]